MANDRMAFNLAAGDGEERGDLKVARIVAGITVGSTRPHDLTHLLCILIII